MPKNQSRQTPATDKHLRLLGKCLVDLRKAAGKKVSELADELGVTKQFIYMLERGEAKPTEDRLNQLTKALNDYEGRLRAVAIKVIEADFVEKLKDTGLSQPQIQEVLSRVGAETKSNLWTGKEELKVARIDEPSDELLESRDDGEEVLALRADSMDPAGVEDSDSASEYARSVRGEFSASQMPGLAKERQQDALSTLRIKAGRFASIEIGCPISTEQKNALKAVAITIDHILKK